MSATLVREKPSTLNTAAEENEFDLDLRITVVPNERAGVVAYTTSDMNSCYQTCYGNPSCTGNTCTNNSPCYCG